MSTAPLSEGRWLKNSVHSHGGGGRWLVLVTEQPSTFNIAAQKMIPVQTILCIESWSHHIYRHLLDIQLQAR